MTTPHKPYNRTIGTGGTMVVYGSLQAIMAIVRWVANDVLMWEVPENVLVAIGVLLAGPVEHFRRKWKVFV